MNWSFDLSQAPRDGSQILMATTNGKRYLTRWLAANIHTPNGRFDGFSENAKTLRAWCNIPDHPDTIFVPESAAENQELLHDRQQMIDNIPLSNLEYVTKIANQVAAKTDITEVAGHWDEADVGGGD